MIDARSGIDKAMRHAFFVSSLIYAAALTICVIAIAAVMPGFVVAKALAGVWILGLVGIGQWGRKARKLGFPVAAFFSLATGGAVIAAIATGGIESFVTPLIVVAPLVAGFVIDIRASFIAAICVVAAVIGIEIAEIAGIAGDPPAMGSALVAAFILVLSTAAFLTAIYTTAVAGHLELFARKTADREFELEGVIKSMPYALAMLDDHLSFLRCSDRWLEDYGIDGKEIVGRSLYDLLPDAPEHWRHALRRCLEGGIEANDGEEVTGADGESRLTAWRARPWRNAAGAIGGVVISSRDISRQRGAQDAAQSAPRAAAVASAEASYEAAHETLREIAGVAELLSRTNLEPHQAKMLHLIRTAGERLGEAISFDAGDIPAGGPAKRPHTDKMAEKQDAARKAG